MTGKKFNLLSVIHYQTHFRFPKVLTTYLVFNVLEEEKFFYENISVVFVGEAYMRTLNRKYFHSSKGTDVISFRLNEGKKIEGEIYVCLDQAQRQAPRFGQTFTNEVARLVIHGTLHLLGYDDQTDFQRAAMKSKEDFYLKYFLHYKNDVRKNRRNTRSHSARD
ncbi:MAG: rRNA maturation RNase YbeY [Ignavibacteriales bacterium]|nr:rRNA maturation RNase YbeY [Ignavibacteriales bacterium]